MANVSTACAACKHQRRKCPSDCPLRPYFPSNSMEFPIVHKMFGVSNVRKKLENIKDAESRDHTAQSIRWEGFAWGQDPVRGPFGSYKRSMIQQRALEFQLGQSKAKTEQLMKVEYDLELENCALKCQLEALKATVEVLSKHNNDLTLKRDELECQLRSLEAQRTLKNSQACPCHMGPTVNALNGSIHNPSTGTSKCGSTTNGTGSVDNLTGEAAGLMQIEAGFRSLLPQRLGLADEIINGVGQMFEEGIDPENLEANNNDINNIIAMFEEPENSYNHPPEIWSYGDEWT